VDARQVECRKILSETLEELLVVDEPIRIPELVLETVIKGLLDPVLPGLALLAVGWGDAVLP
jgi:hypothetical protein